jgi:hypothetical protein
LWQNRRPLANKRREQESLTNPVWGEILVGQHPDEWNELSRRTGDQLWDNRFFFCGSISQEGHNLTEGAQFG